MKAELVEYSVDADTTVSAGGTATATATISTSKLRTVVGILGLGPQAALGNAIILKVEPVVENNIARYDKVRVTLYNPTNNDVTVEAGTKFKLLVVGY